MKNTIRTKIIGISSFAAVIVILLAGLLLTGCPDTEEEEKPTVNIPYILGVTVPAIGYYPVGAITPTPQYTGTVSWEGARDIEGKFQAGEVYTATITLTVRDDYTLDGVPANFFRVAGADSVTNAANSGVIKAIFPRTSITAVNLAAIPGVAVPVIGDTPKMTITETAQYTGTVTWKKADGSSFTGNFVSATAYTATITLNPKLGYTLEGVAANFFTVAGATSVTNAANSGVVTARFPAASTTVTILAIQGITAPETGKVPAKTITETAQYTGTVTWTNAAGSTLTGNFAAGTVYTATITLTAKTGYTFQGVRANSFNVPGATATNAVNTGLVTAVFPSTIAVVNIKAIAGLTPPSIGGRPVSSITPTEQYTGTVTWPEGSSSFSGSFEADKVYTAHITLTAANGYTFTGVTSNYFTVAGATKATNSANSGYIIVTFPKIVSNTPITGIYPVAGQTAPGSIPSSNANSSQYSGKITWTTANGTSFSGKFAEGTAYTATITLTEKSGYTLQGVPANYFSVDMATSTTNLSNSGVITARFPSTGNTSSSTKRTTVNIQNVTFNPKPVSGVAIPTNPNNSLPNNDVKVAETLQYTGIVDWKGATGYFSQTTTINAEIILTAKPGFTFTGIAKNYFTVEGQTRTNTENDAIAAVTPSPIEPNPYPTVDTVTIKVTQFIVSEGEVTDKTIKGINTPTFDISTSLGTKVDRNINSTDQYIGRVTWYEKGSTGEFTDEYFGPGMEYKAEITLTAKTGYTFKGVAADSFTVEGASLTSGQAKSVTNPAGTGPTIVVTVVYKETTFIPISYFIIPKVVFPKAGESPEQIPLDPDNNQFTAAITWPPNLTKFATGTAYTVDITVTPKKGYGYANTDSFNVTSPTGATPTSAIFNATTGIIKVTFPATESQPNRTITVNKTGTTTPGIPVKGELFTGLTIANVDSTISELKWTSLRPERPTGAPVFEADTEYTVTFVLTPKTGYTLVDVSSSYFVVTGASSTTYAVASNKGTVTAKFPKTDAAIALSTVLTTNELKAISGITPPATGGTPTPAHNNSITAGTVGGKEVYTGKVEWKIGNTNITTAQFAAKTVYTATITLTAEPGYTFTGVPANFFTVAGVNTVSNPAGSTAGNPPGVNIVVTATFPRTAGTGTDLAVVDIKAIPIAAPVKGAPVTSFNATSQYTGTVQWQTAAGVGVSGTFAASTVYKATITLTASTGYTFQGVPINFFTVAGGTATNTVNSGIVTVTFPATGP